MGRILGILIVAIMIGGAVLTYATKHRAEEAGDRVLAIKSEIAATKNRIAMLRAEWSVLTQPSRLQTLTERFKAQLGLVNLEATQMVSVDDVPTRIMLADNKTDAKAAETKAATTPTIKPVTSGSGDPRSVGPARSTPPEVRTATVPVNSSNARPAGSEPRPAAPVRTAALSPSQAAPQAETKSGWRWPSFFRRAEPAAAPQPEARATAPAQATGKPFSLVPPSDIPTKASR